MDQFIAELHFYLRENFYHQAIDLCTEELEKGRDPYVSFWRGYAYSQEGSLIEAIRDVEPLLDYQDYQLSATLALLTYHNMYSTPDMAKINKLQEQLIDFESNSQRDDILNAMRFETYLKDEEKYLELLDKFKSLNSVDDGLECIVQGWKNTLDDNPENWKIGKDFFETYIRNNGSGNLDVIFGGLKCLERMKSYEEALDTYSEIMKINSKFFPLHLEKLYTYLLKNDYELANDYITQKKINVQHFEIFKILTLCSLMLDGDIKNAEYNFRKMWELMQKTEPKNPNLYYLTGKLFSRTCDKNKDILFLCEELFDKALEFNPNDARYLLEKAYITIYKGDYEKGIEMFTKCGELDTESREPTIGLIYTKILQNKIKEASNDVKFMKEMLENTNTKNAKISLFDAITSSKLGVSESEVLKLVKEALKIYIEMNKSLHSTSKYDIIINTEYDFLFDMAEVLMNFYSFDVKISEGALPDILKQAARILSLLKRNKYMISAQLLSAKLSFLQGKNQEAFSIIDDVLAIDQKNMEALMFKTLLCIESKDFSKAKEVINDTMINNLQETKENSSFLILKSKCELGLNDIENSQKTLNQAISVFDLTIEKYNPAKHSLFHLTKKDKLELMKLNIDILLKLGKTEEAQSYMNKLVVEFQDLGDELLMLHSDLALKTGDLKKAVNLLHKVEDKDEATFKKSRIKLSKIYLDQVMDRRLYSWCYNEILEKFPTFDNYKLAANALMDINSPDEAVDYYKKAINIKNDMEVMRDLGRALVRTHDYKEAIDYYMQSSEIDERGINNQNVLNYWEMINDFLDLMFLLARNSDENDPKAKNSKVSALKTQIETNIEKINKYIHKYDDYHLKSILARFKFMEAQVINSLYQEDKDSVKKESIYATLEETVKIEKEALSRLKELKDEKGKKESMEFLSQVWYQIGRYYELLEPKLEFCQKAYAESVKNDQTNTQALYAISNLLMKKGIYGEAQSYIDLLLHEDESNDDALALLVSVLNAQINKENALAYLENTIKRQPNSYHLIELYISILQRSGNLTNAKDILHKSERTLKYIYTPGLYYCKGLFYRNMGEINKALIEFSKAKTDEDYGIKCIEQILEIYMNPDCDILLINLDIPWNSKVDGKPLLNYFTNDLNLDAIYFLLRELKTRRDDDRTKVYATYVAILTKDINKINQNCGELQDILNKDQENLPAWIALIMAYLIMKKIKEAKTFLDIMDRITLNIKYYTDYERGYLILAYIMMMTDNFKKAEEYLTKVLSLNIAQIKAYEFFAMIRDKQGIYTEAVGYYERAWEYSNKNNANIGYKLAISYINSKQYVKALNICNEIKRKFKEYPIDDLASQAKNGLGN